LGRGDLPHPTAHKFTQEAFAEKELGKICYFPATVTDLQHVTKKLRQLPFLEEMLNLLKVGQLVRQTLLQVRGSPYQACAHNSQTRK
jgi:hypothetical protein